MHRQLFPTLGGHRPGNHSGARLPAHAGYDPHARPAERSLPADNRAAARVLLRDFLPFLRPREIYVLRVLEKLAFWTALDRLKFNRIASEAMFRAREADRHGG
jgi:hypothetical protein